MSQTPIPPSGLEARSSRWWAFFHFNFKRLLFPERMIADHVGISTIAIKRWYAPWERVDEHLPFSHVAEVTHIRRLIWDSITVESSGGLDPLVIDGLRKSQARYFVDHVRARLNEIAVLPQAPPR